MSNESAVKLNYLPKVLSLGDHVVATLLKGTEHIDDDGERYNAIVYSVMNQKTFVEGICVIMVDLLESVENKIDFMVDELLATKEAINIWQATEDFHNEVSV